MWCLRTVEVIQHRPCWQVERYGLVSGINVCWSGWINEHVWPRSWAGYLSEPSRTQYVDSGVGETTRADRKTTKPSTVVDTRKITNNRVYTLDPWIQAQTSQRDRICAHMKHICTIFGFPKLKHAPLRQRQQEKFLKSQVRLLPDPTNSIHHQAVGSVLLLYPKVNARYN